MILIVGDAGLGDGGKGTSVDNLVRVTGARTVVRYNGGSQPAHNVVLPDGRHHTCAQFGSGIFMPGTETIHSQYVLINPLALLEENEVLKIKGVTDALDRLKIHRDCLVITPFQVIMNRIRELVRANKCHGSCGKGVGETAADGKIMGKMALRMNDLYDQDALYEKLRYIRLTKLDTAEQLISGQDNDEIRHYYDLLANYGYFQWVVEAYTKFVETSRAAVVDTGYLKEKLAGGDVIFEGAQGVLLDPVYGFYPYITKTRTTAENAFRLIRECDYQGEVKILSAMRPYATRHGAGPFVTEDSWLTKTIPDRHNIFKEWQRGFRIGWFDSLTARYAMEVSGGADEIILTNLDRLSVLKKIYICISYEYTGINPGHLDGLFEWERTGDGKTRITGIKKIDGADIGKREEASRIMFDCRPLEFMEFPGWQKDISGVKSFDGLPPEAREYVHFIEEIVGIPISMISVGPTWTHKINL